MTESHDMTRRELKRAIDAAHDDYLGVLDSIAHLAGCFPASPRQLQENPETRGAAARAWASFKAKQDELNQEYFAPRDAAALEREKAEHEAETNQVRLRQAYGNRNEAVNNLNHERDRIDSMRDAGIAVSDDEAAQILATAQAQIDHWIAEIDRLAAAQPPA